MVKRFIFIFLALNFLVLCGGVDHAKAKARKSLSKVNRKLKLLNKPAVKSIKVYFSRLSVRLISLKTLSLIS
jgi:hypothetical protein